MKKQSISILAVFCISALVLSSCTPPNARFQKAWYHGVRQVATVPRAGAGSISDLQSEFDAQLGLARRYGGARIVFIGDSNAEYAARERTMRRFRAVAANLGVGGTTTDDWVRYFRSVAGSALRQELQLSNTFVLISLGGNDVLRDRMGGTLENYRTLRGWFPRSAIVLIPPIHAGAMAARSDLSRAHLVTGIERVNRMAAAVFGADVIDTSEAFQDAGTGEAYPGLMRDPIHLSELAYSLIIETVNRIFET